jgi:hypothetical protein
VPDARCVEFDAKYSQSDIFQGCRYPHSVEAKVVAVTDCESDWRLGKLNKGSLVQHIKLAKAQQEIRIGSAEDALDGLRKQCGIDIDNCNLFLEVYPHNLPSSFSGSSGFHEKHTTRTTIVLDLWQISYNVILIILGTSWELLNWSILTSANAEYIHSPLSSSAQELLCEAL